MSTDRPTSACNTSIVDLRKLQGRRRYSAKVRTGCRTCKIRRVKCDESKPACARCVGTGRKCDGYAQDASFSSEALATSRSSSLARSVPMLSDLGDSVLYLEFYYHCAGHTLSSNFDHQFWSRIVLQMAQSEEAIRHAVIALGSIVKVDPRGNRPAHYSAAISNRKTLLVHHNKAVRCLIDRMAQPSYSIEIGLVAGLLFMCIEYLKGDYNAAFTHLHSGLRIISEWQQKLGLASQKRSVSPSSSTSLSKSSSGPEVITENLVPMFNRAIATGLLCGAPFEPILLNFCPTLQSPQAQAFASIYEAQSTYHDLRNATIIMISVFFRTILAGNQPTTQDLQQREHLLFCHESWLEALHDLEREGNLSKEDKIVASSTKVAYYSSYPYLAGAIDCHLTGYDAYTSCFQALNYHARIVLDSMNLDAPFQTRPSFTTTERLASSSNTSKSAAAHFTFEISLVPTLFWAATRCRCPATRRESASLLARNPPREAIWDAERAVVIASRVIELEESAIDPQTGRPAQKTRIAHASVEGEANESGGFWVSFTSISWLMRGMRPDDPLRHRGDRVPTAWNSEWDEWLVL